MVLLRPVLPDGQKVNLSIAARHVLHVFQMFHLTRRVHAVGLERRLPDGQNVILRPRRVHHHAVRAATDQAVQDREQPIIVELRPRQERILRHVTLVVVRRRPVGDPTQHVGADGRVVSVGSDFTFADALEDWIREGVA